MRRILLVAALVALIASGPGCVSDDDLADLTVPELVEWLGRGGADQRRATLELINRGRSVVPELVVARRDAPDPVQRSIDSVLQELDYFYLQNLIALFDLLRDFNVDVTDAAAGLPEGPQTAEQLVAALLERLEAAIEALDLRRRRDGLADADPERTWIAELDRWLTALRETAEAIRELARQNPAASGAPQDLLDRLTEAENGVRQYLERIIELIGEGDYDGDGTSNVEELRRGDDPLRPGPF